MVLKTCAHDMDKTNNICIGKDQLFIEHTRKSIKRFDKSIKNITNNRDFNAIEKERLVQLLKNNKEQQFLVAKNEISAVSCIENDTQPFDQLYVLHPMDVILKKNFNMPVTPIEVAKGKCKKLVNKTFLKQFYKPEELLIDLTKNTLDELRAKLE